MQKTFSIVTVAFNAEDLIEDTMRSVFNQSFTDYEYIIIDGKSKDKTMSIIEKYKDKIDILISEPDEGIYDAMNKGISLASGRYVNFMNCGDFFADESVLEIVSRLIDNNPDIIYGNTIINTIVGKYLVRPGKIDETIIKRMPFCHQSTFVKTELARLHPFDLTYKVAADYNMFLHLYKEDKSFLYVDYPIAIYQNDGNSIDHQSYKRIIEAARVNQSFMTKIKAYIRWGGGYLRSILPDSFYKMYRRYKYSHNPHFELINEIANCRQL